MSRLRGLAAAALAGSLLGSASCRDVRVIRVCADPNNLPFSNEAREGFENRIAALLAADRGARLEYTWWAQRRGFVRNTLQAGACDVVMGVPSGFEPTRTSRPYYRSTYVFAARRDRGARLASLDDPRLRELRIGVQMIGDDFANTPPAHALARRGLVRNVVGFPVYGDYSRPAPLSAIVDAVDRGDVDAAVVWGPAAGYFAKAAQHPLELTPVSPQGDSPALPFVFDISMGVRRGDAGLQAELDDFIGRRRADIDRILDDYGVPRIEGGR
ncbi:MAG TPA: substrate-binding domain-containing protein [Vicinamibacterales bacterium]|nr:substrate-binding domain-containing protein [Vicinamibacterales bacterium]